MDSSISLPNVVVRSMLASRSRCLNVASLNVQSLLPNIDEIRHTFNGTPVDILCFSETFLSSDISDSAIAIDGFNLFRKDRANPPFGYGGLCMYVGEHIKCKPVCLPSSISQTLTSDLEFLFVNVFICGRKFLFGVVYNPPKTNKRSYAQFKKSLVDIEGLFSFFAYEYDEIFISGDFNVDILQNSSISRSYLNILDSLNLSVYNTDVPTHFCPTTSSICQSLIDHVISLDNNSICFFNQLSLGIGSHHDLLVFSVDCFCPYKPKSFSFRDFGNIDDRLLALVCMSIPWDRIFLLSSSTGQVELFNSFVNDIFDRCVPLREVIIRPKSLHGFRKKS